MTVDDLLAAQASKPIGPSPIDALLLKRANAPAAEPPPNPATQGGHFSIGPWDIGLNTPPLMDQVLSGAGKAFSDLGTGASQLIARAQDWVDPEASRVSTLQKEVAQTRKQDAPLMSTWGGVGGNLAGNVAATLPAAFIPGANTYMGQAAIGATLGALQPSESTGEGVAQAALGTAGAVGGKYVGDKMASLVNYLKSSPNLTPGQQQALQTAQQLGFKTTPASQSGNKQLSQVEAWLASHPETSAPFTAVADNNQKALNTIAAKAIGENADNVSSQTMNQAVSRLGSVFDSVADKTPVPLDPTSLGPKLKQVLSDSEGMIAQNGSLADNGLFKRLDDFINTNGGATREQLRDLSSKLGQAAKSNMTTQSGDRALGEAQFGLQNIVEDAIQGSLSPAQQAEYSQARQQYKTLMNLTARNTVVNPSSGNVSGQSLANVLMSKDKGGFTFGNNDSDLYNAARFVQAFPKLVNDSGTATRSRVSLAQIPMMAAGAVASPAYMSLANAVQKPLDPKIMAIIAALGKPATNAIEGNLASQIPAYLRNLSQQQ